MRPYRDKIARDGPNDRLSDISGFEGMVEREADCSASDARCHRYR